MPEIVYRKFHPGQQKLKRELKDNRFMIIRAGRRFGKTTALEEWACIKAARGLKVGWFAPSYKLISPSYGRINQTLKPIRETASKIDGLITTITGGSIEVWSLDNEDAGRSRSYDLAIIDEASLKAKGLRDIWDRSIKPTLLDRGGRAIMAGTPKGIDQDNYFYLACTDKTLGWHEFHAPTSANPTLDREGVENLKNEYPPLVYQQEFLAEFVDWNGSAFFSEESMLDNGKPVDYPVRPDQIYAVVDTALKDGIEHDGTAVTYYARNKIAGHPLIILDYDLVQMEGSLLDAWLPSVDARCEELSRITNARYGHVGVWVEDKASGIVLIQQAQRKGMNVHAIDGVLTSMGKDGRSISVSSYVFQGMVKISTYAFEKVINFKGQTRNHFMYQVCGYRVGTKTPHTMDLLDTFTYGVAIGLGDVEGY